MSFFQLFYSSLKLIYSENRIGASPSPELYHNTLQILWLKLYFSKLASLNSLETCSVNNLFLWSTFLLTHRSLSHKKNLSTQPTNLVQLK